MTPLQMLRGVCSGYGDIVTALRHGARLTCPAATWAARTVYHVLLPCCPATAAHVRFRSAQQRCADKAPDCCPELGCKTNIRQLKRRSSRKTGGYTRHRAVMPHVKSR